jgi:hypothetical protein
MGQFSAKNPSRPGQLSVEINADFGLDGNLLGLWNGLSVPAHLEQQFGQNETERADGPIVQHGARSSTPRRHDDRPFLEEHSRF